MTKQEFLNKLSHEELLLLRDMVSSYDVIRELSKRNTKTLIEVKVGDCFAYRNDCGDIFLTKVIGCAPENPYFDGQYFDCEEISIDDHEIDMYSGDNLVEDFEEHDRIDSEIFDKVAALINSRNDAIDKIREEFDKQIRELCSTSLNIQNKN